MFHNPEILKLESPKNPPNPCYNPRDMCLMHFGLDAADLRFHIAPQLEEKFMNYS